LDLAPQNDAQRWLKSTALQISSTIAEARWLVAEQAGSSIQWPFLAILVFWLAIIFTSFGLFAPWNGSVITALFVCALSVAGSIYLIVEMDQPTADLSKSPALRSALFWISSADNRPFGCEAAERFVASFELDRGDPEGLAAYD
jgi:hypothetical protein